jgi:hypothetical protein
MVVAYAPMDAPDAFVKDAFHLLMFGYLMAVPPIDKVVVQGDFNTQLGHGWESFAGAMGRHHLDHSEVPSDNGEHLLDLAASFGLHMANTFFPHQFGHLGT